MAAVSWPGRFVGPLGGAPFDVPFAAIAFGVLLPALWCFHPAFLRTGLARGLVGGLIAWKLVTWVIVPQAGWCGTFLTKFDASIGGARFASSWDARTFWQTPLPACSTIVTHAYVRQTQFPAWIINIPFGYDWDSRVNRFDDAPVENPRPPDGHYTFLATGTLYASAMGTLTIGTGSDTELTGTVDGQPLVAAHGQTARANLDAGAHTIDIALNLTGRGWQFIPLWNGRDVFSALPTSTAPMSAADRAVPIVGKWVTPLLVVALLALWLGSAMVAMRPTALMVAATASIAAATAWLGAGGETSSVARFAAVPLAVSMVIPVPRHLRNGRGAWLLVGVPWLAAIAARGFHRIGAFTLFLLGDDALTYQRFAYRIFHDGYWLEGGQRTFWNQPLYRWICGSLHVVFGDSSVGELFVDGFALLLGAVFAFHVARRLSGFRGGLAAAVVVLLTVTLGPNWYLIGRGLSEMTAAGWLYGAALMVMRARRGSIHTAAAAGVLGFLAFVTRLNHLPIVVALVALLLPVRGEWVDLRRPTVRTLVRWRAAVTYLAVLGCGIAAFAVRTWYYTGVLSLFAGTTRVHNATGLGLTLESMLSRDAWRSAFESVLMIVTVADPPRLDPRAAFVIAGVALALLRVVRLKGVSTRVALGPAVVCVSALAAGLFVRGLAYPGRFSIHLIPVAVAISVGALATRWAALHPRRQHAAAPVRATEFVR